MGQFEPVLGGLFLTIRAVVAGYKRGRFAPKEQPVEDLQQVLVAYPGSNLDRERLAGVVAGTASISKLPPVLSLS